MTPDQWHTIRTTVLTNWGTTSKWTKAADLYPDVRALPFDTMRQALTEIRDSGREHAPAPGELIGITKQRAGSITENRRPEPAKCDHAVIAITDYQSNDPTDPGYEVPAERWCAVCLTEMRPRPVQPPPFQPDRRLIGHMEKGNP